MTKFTLRTLFVVNFLLIFSRDALNFRRFIFFIETAVDQKSVYGHNIRDAGVNTNNMNNGLDTGLSQNSCYL